MSRSERKRRYRARRRWRDWRPLAPVDDEVRQYLQRAQAEAQSAMLKALCVPAHLLEGKPRAGLDFGHPNAAVVVADRTPDGQWGREG